MTRGPNTLSINPPEFDVKIRTTWRTVFAQTQEAWPRPSKLSLCTLLNLMSKSGRLKDCLRTNSIVVTPGPQNSLYPHSWKWCQNPDDLKDCLRTNTRLMTPSPNTLSLSTLLNLMSKSWRPEGLSSHKNCCWVLGSGPDSYMFDNIVFAYDNESESFWVWWGLYRGGEVRQFTHVLLRSANYVSWSSRCSPCRAHPRDDTKMYIYIPTVKQSSNYNFYAES